MANVRHDSADQCNYMKVEQYFRGQNRGDKIKYTLATCGDNNNQLDSSRVRTLLAKDTSFDENGLIINGDVIVIDTPISQLNCPSGSTWMQGDGEDPSPEPASPTEKRSSPEEEAPAESEEGAAGKEARDIQGDAGNPSGDMESKILILNLFFILTQYSSLQRRFSIRRCEQHLRRSRPCLRRRRPFHLWCIRWSDIR